MCRSIKRLYKESVVTDEDIYNASLQFVRKISGMHKPSKINQTVFDKSVKEISLVTDNLLHNLDVNNKK